MTPNNYAECERRILPHREMSEMPTSLKISHANLN
jgi:hypothetical protein